MPALNRFPAPCQICGVAVPAGAGYLQRGGSGRWTVIHIQCSAEAMAVTPPPIRPPSVEVAWMEFEATSVFDGQVPAPTPAPVETVGPLRDLTTNFNSILEGWHLTCLNEGSICNHPAIWPTEELAKAFMVRVKRNLEKVNLTHWIRSNEKNLVTFYCVDDEEF